MAEYRREFPRLYLHEGAYHQLPYFIIPPQTKPALMAGVHKEVFNQKIQFTAPSSGI